MDSTVNFPDPNPSAGPSIDPTAADALPSPGADAALMRAAFPSTRIRPQEWEKHRRLIETMHASEHSMKDIKSYMELTHGFFASESQWKKKLSQWKLRRNLGKGVARFVGKRALRRRNEQQKETEFRYKGLPQPAEKVERHIKDLQKCIENGGAPSSTEGKLITPEDVSYHTIASPSLGFVASRAEDHGDAPHPLASDNIGTLRMAFHEGKSLNQWMSVANEAASSATEGRYMEAKTKMIHSLDALEALLGPDDAKTTDLLAYFVETASEHEDFDEAASRLHKSHRNHCDTLGQTHVRTWQSLIRLGTFYKDRGDMGEAYHMLFNARQGLLAKFKDDPEQALNYTHDVSISIVAILRAQDDFLAAEREIKLAIERTEAAGAVHGYTVVYLRHQLAHLYNDSSWRYMTAEGRIPYPTPNVIEPILLEGISSLRKYNIHRFEMYLCAFEQLRIFYERTLQHEKLPGLLTEIESYITPRSALSESVLRQCLKSMEGLALSYETLGMYGAAEWWLLHRQEQINMEPCLGPASFEAVTNQMRMAELYLHQQKPHEERQALKQAQSLARYALPADHDFHAYVANVLNGIRTGKTRCECCLVNAVRVAPEPRRPFPGIKVKDSAVTEFDTLSSGDADSSVE